MDGIVPAYLKGLATMLSLIMAIGVQNAFVLRQGILKQGALLAATLCFLCDTTLVVLGTYGLERIISDNLFLKVAIATAGAIFLAYYGGRSFLMAKRANGLDTSTQSYSRSNLVITALAVSLLNPHALIDTIVLVGGLAARYHDAAQMACVAGALTGSALWFYCLALAARPLAPILKSPKNWRYIDLFVGCMMWWLSISLFIDTYKILRDANIL